MSGGVAAVSTPTPAEGPATGVDGDEGAGTVGEGGSSG